MRKGRGVGMFRQYTDFCDDGEDAVGNLLLVPPLAADMVDPGRWSLVVARPWRPLVAIHHGEARAAL